MAPCFKNSKAEVKQFQLDVLLREKVSIQANTLREDVSSKIHLCSSVKAERKMAVTQPVKQAGFHETLMTCPKQS